MNPPTLLRLVEVVPAPYTLRDVTEGAVRMLEEAGQVPVVLRKEMPGFVVNRLQYALLNECWRLVQVCGYECWRLVQVCECECWRLVQVCGYECWSLVQVCGYECWRLVQVCGYECEGGVGV